ncbi:helix-turn-helix domain-containing protein [Geopsychrobacter electrodiphilus]|uniref:helix-turn-helix domain-containing protein n=1 Tax=Geopsychrobacter electrodiphilus TaxID=225196 RepID=UPI00037AE869|nr:helix-turn-helix transcriptional regulator [Geopsychrobacter electrodiphilus]
MTLGKKIRSIRGDRTIASFVEGYGICPNTLMNYEAERRKPDAAFLTRLCELEGVEPNWLLGVRETSDTGVQYKRSVLEMVADEATRQATFQIGPKMGKLLTLAYERAAISNAGKRQIEEIVRELLDLLDSYGKKEQGRSERHSEQPQIAC